MLPEGTHNIALGIVKDLIQYTFKDKSASGVVRNKKRTKSQLIDAEGLNDVLNNTRVPKEFHRATRDISLGSFKAEEYRNILIHFFPGVIR
jgi:hypothetical protein